MVWFIMKTIAYGFEVIMISLMTFIFIGIMAERRPDLINKIFNMIVIDDDDI